MTGAGPHDAVVVGCGPVGATLANLLGARGLRVVVLESTTSVYHLPRAAHFDGEVMRVFQAAGLAEQIAPVTASIAGMHFLDAGGRKLFGYDAPQGPGPHGWPDNSMFYQPDLERVLRAGVARFPHVEVRLGHEVEAIRDHGDVVDVTVRDIEHARTHTVQARYVLGCDGARSLTRSSAGIALDDLEFDQPWLVVDTVLTAPVDLPAHSIQYCDPARPVTFVPMGGDRRRWEFMLMPGETLDEMERPERVRSLLSPWVGSGQCDVVRAAVYTFHALVARPWRRGRLLVVGDAAHQMPPFLGQGMCAGIRDAHNLAWKLDLVLRGLAGEGLLDTYEAERSPHVRTIIETAVSAGRVIQTTDPDVAAARDTHFRGGGRPPADNRVRMPGLATGVLADDPSAGELLSQPVLPGEAGAALLDEACGDGFAVVGRDDARAEMVPESAAWLEKIGTAFVARPELSGWLDAAGARYVVLRPDRYVFGVAGSVRELDGLAARLSSHLAG